MASKKYKAVLLGESGVGKTSLVVRLVKNEYQQQHSTVGASFFRYGVTLEDGNVINFDLWDTAGQERYKSLASMYYRGSAAALVVYDITSIESFDRARYWIRELRSNSPDTIISLVGNKCDMEEERQVTMEEGRELAQECGLMHFEASAQEGIRVQHIFTEMAARLAKSNQQTVKGGGVVHNGQPSVFPSSELERERKKKCRC